MERNAISIHDDCWRPRPSKLVRAGAVAIFLAALGAKAAVADGVDDVVEVLVEASTAGAQLGLPAITPEEGNIIKLIVRCAESSTRILTCARQQVIASLPIQLPPEAIDCVLDGTPPEQCLSEELLNSLDLPLPVRKLLDCVSQTGNLGNCTDKAVTDQEKEVLGLIVALKADAQSDAMTELDAATQGNLRNIITLSKAIDANDWPNVSFYGGVQFYQAAAPIVLNAVVPGLLTGPQGKVLTPVVEAIINSRAEALEKVITAGEKHDVGGVSEAVIEFYMSDSAVVSCTLLNEINTDLKAAVCGPISDIIHTIAATAGRITNDVLDAITNPLNIGDDILGVLEIAIELADPADAKLCPKPPSQYYANSYARCYHRGVRLLSSNTAQFEQLVQSLDIRCKIDHYDHCFTVNVTANVNPICDPQKGMFSNHVSQLLASVNSAANSYQQYFPQLVRKLAREQGLAAACNRQLAVEKFLEDCATQVKVQVPLLGDPDSDNCDTGPSTFFPPVVQRAACERAMALVDADAVLRDVCAPLVALTVDAALLGESVLPVIPLP
jgi:hypothetical protein